MNRYHNPDSEAEAVAQHIEPMYCARCGSRLHVLKMQRKGFDKNTGHPRYDVMRRCPHAVLYETSIMGRPLLTWQSPFDRHTIHKVSRVIELNWDFADVHFRRASAYCETGEHDKATVEYTKAIQLNPSDAKTYYHRGLAYYNNGDVPRALDDLRKSIKLSTDAELTKDAQQALHRIKISR